LDTKANVSNRRKKLTKTEIIEATKIISSLPEEERKAGI
jgi:membrane-bound lytic murein transglycosylase B